MINELESKDYLYSKSKTFNDYFVKREKTDNEIKKETIIIKLILDFYQKVYDKEMKELDNDIFDFDLCDFGYIDNYGYYVINYDNWGYYLVHCYGEDLLEIFSTLVRSVLNAKRRNYLCKNRKIIKNEYRNRFRHFKNYDVIFNAEYDLDKWNKYYNDEIPEEIINRYNDYVNNNYYLSKVNNILEYDKKYKIFKYTSNLKKRSLKK